MDDNKKKDKKVKKKENVPLETKLEIEECEVAKEEKKEIDDIDLAHQFEVEESRMHENEYPSSNDLVYVI